MQPAWARLVLLLGGLLTITAFWAVAQEFYSGFLIPQGFGMTFILPSELTFHLWFVVFGSAALLLLTRAMEGAALSAAGRRVVRLSRTRPGFLLAAASAALFLGSGWVGAAWTGHAVLTDDEHAYRFIAQTLRSGAVVAPSPGGDLPFFKEQFVVLDERVRFGKYPIGQPLLLAAGQAAGVEPLVGPVVTALLVVPLWVIAVLLFDIATATLGVALLVLSPQIVFTGATYLSQPTSALCLVCAVALLLWSTRGPGLRPAGLLGAGAALGLGVLVRPLPGVLFAAVAITWLLLLPVAWPERSKRVALCAAPLVLAAVVLGWINHLQSGGALNTGYQQLHATGEGATGLMGLLAGGSALRVMSVAGSVLRENVWLLGWPLCLVPCLFAPVRPGVRLVWALIAAAMVYRVLSPKVGVGSTGPLYLHEIVPLLCVLAAAGIVRLAREGRVLTRERAAALLIAGTVVSATMFVPVQAATVRRMARAQLLLPALLAQRGVQHAVVFHEGAVPLWAGLTWAYYPRFNGPAFDDDVLFLYAPEAAMAGAVDVWRRRFPDRSAWSFRYDPDGRPLLVPLSRPPGATP